MKETIDGGEAGLPFLGGFSDCHGRDFFEPKNREFEDQIEIFLYSFQGFVLARYSLNFRLNFFGIDKVTKVLHFQMSKRDRNKYREYFV